MPRETLACLRNLDLPAQFIHGNGDREALAWRKGRESGTVPEQYRESMRWVAQQLHAADDEWIASWPATLRLRIDGIGEVLFCHATPRNDTEIFTSRTAEEKLRPLFDDVGVRVCVCGHTHMQFDRMVGATRVVNAGSVGMPFGNPGAYWLLLGSSLELRWTPYDLAAAAGRIRDTQYPKAEEFAARNILQPPSEQEILVAFSGVELT